MRYTCSATVKQLRAGFRYDGESERCRGVRASASEAPSTSYISEERAGDAEDLPLARRRVDYARLAWAC